MSNLYCVTAQVVLYVLADSPKEAEEIGLDEAELWYCITMPSVVEVTGRGPVLPPWDGNRWPYSVGPARLTINEFLAAKYPELRKDPLQLNLF